MDLALISESLPKVFSPNPEFSCNLEGAAILASPAWSLEDATVGLKPTDLARSELAMRNLSTERPRLLQSLQSYNS